MLFEGLTRLEHLAYLMNDRISTDNMDDDTIRYLDECNEFINTIREVWN